MMSRLAAALGLASLLLVAGCSPPPPPVSVGEGMVTVLNQTDQDWKDAAHSLKGSASAEE